MSPLVLGDDLLDKVEKLIEETGDIDVLRRAALIVFYEGGCGWLEQHDPRGHQQYGKLPCTGDTYHRCSYTGSHASWCKAAGGSGEPDGEFKNAESCETDCEEGDAEPWCKTTGYDCTGCKAVADLNLILAEVPA